MNNVYPTALSITALTGGCKQQIQQPWVKLNQMARRRRSGESNIVWHCVSARATGCNSPAGLRVYPELQGTAHMPFLFTSLHCVGTGWPLQTTFSPLQKKKKWHSSLRLPFFSTKVLRCSVKRRGVFLYSVRNKAAFWGGVLSCITHQEERGNKQGQIHQTEGVARRDGERWVLIKVEQLNSF